MSCPSDRPLMDGRGVNPFGRQEIRPGSPKVGYHRRRSQGKVGAAKGVNRVGIRTNAVHPLFPNRKSIRCPGDGRDVESNLGIAGGKPPPVFGSEDQERCTLWCAGERGSPMLSHRMDPNTELKLLERH